VPRPGDGRPMGGRQFAMAPMTAKRIPRQIRAMPPIHETLARVSDRPCSRNLLWAIRPSTTEAGVQMTKQTMPMMASTCGVLFCSAGAP